MLVKSDRKNHSVQVCLIFFSLYLRAPSLCWRQFKMTSGKRSINSDTLIFLKKSCISSLLIKTNKVSKNMSLKTWHDMG